jgi:hypothetical protein
VRAERELIRDEVARHNGASRGMYPVPPPAAVLDHDERASQGAPELTGWCPKCQERAVPMRDGTCGFCSTPLEGLPETPTTPAPSMPKTCSEDAANMKASAPGSLHMGPDLDLPLTAATESLAILAVKGAGKSNAAAVLAEEMFDEGIPWVVIDPKGDWWGVREAVDGSRGLPVPVFGGQHGDLPLSAYSGRQVAQLIVERNLTCVLDVSWMDDDERPQFLADLGQDLFALHQHHPSVRHLIVEEANEVLPQTGGTREMRRAWTRIVCQGRQRGLGITLVSQRSALVNKNVLTQTGSLIVLRTTSPQDRAVIRGWVDFHSVGKELVDSLPELENGEAWIVAPFWLGRVDRVRLRRRWTFDSGATPLVVSSRRPQVDVDLEELQRVLAGPDEPPEDAPAPDGQSDAAPVGELGYQAVRGVFSMALANGPLRRPELADATELPGNVFSEWLERLIEDREIVKTGYGNGTRYAMASDATDSPPPVAPTTVAGQVITARRAAEEALEVMDDLLSSDAAVMLRARYLAVLLKVIEQGDTREEMLDRFERIAGMS